LHFTNFVGKIRVKGYIIPKINIKGGYSNGNGKILKK
jgi:hypothetical protein